MLLSPWVVCLLLWSLHAVAGESCVTKLRREKAYVESIAECYGVERLDATGIIFNGSTALAVGITLRNGSMHAINRHARVALGHELVTISARGCRARMMPWQVELRSMVLAHALMRCYRIFPAPGSGGVVFDQNKQIVAFHLGTGFHDARFDNVQLAIGGRGPMRLAFSTTGQLVRDVRGQCVFFVAQLQLYGPVIPRLLCPYSTFSVDVVKRTLYLVITFTIEIRRYVDIKGGVVTSICTRTSTPQLDVPYLSQGPDGYHLYKQSLSICKAAGWSWDVRLLSKLDDASDEQVEAVWETTPSYDAKTGDEQHLPVFNIKAVNHLPPEVKYGLYHKVSQLPLGIDKHDDTKSASMGGMNKILEPSSIPKVNAGSYLETKPSTTSFNEIDDMSSSANKPFALFSNEQLEFGTDAATTEPAMPSTQNESYTETSNEIHGASLLPNESEFVQEDVGDEDEIDENEINGDESNGDEIDDGETDEDETIENEINGDEIDDDGINGDEVDDGETDEDETNENEIDENDTDDDLYSTDILQSDATLSSAIILSNQLSEADGEGTLTLSSAPIIDEKSLGTDTSRTVADGVKAIDGDLGSTLPTITSASEATEGTNTKPKRRTPRPLTRQNAIYRKIKSTTTSTKSKKTYRLNCGPTLTLNDHRACVDERGINPQWGAKVLDYPCGPIKARNIFLNSIGVCVDEDDYYSYIEGQVASNPCQSGHMLNINGHCLPYHGYYQTHNICTDMSPKQARYTFKIGSTGCVPIPTVAGFVLTSQTDSFAILTTTDSASPSISFGEAVSQPTETSTDPSKKKKA